MMTKLYTKNTWVDEVLFSDARYNILEDGGTTYKEEMQIVLSTAVAVAGSAVNADRMNNIEEGIDALDTLLSSIRNAATELTIASGVLAITQSNHSIQPETGTADDIVTINDTVNGQFGVFYVTDFGTDTITFKHGTGNIICFGGTDVALSNGCVFWFSNGTNVFISGGGGGGGGGGADENVVTSLIMAFG